jgi:hypothetical protein
MPAPDYAVEIASLRAGLANSELTIETNGERVTYPSFVEIAKRIGYFEGLRDNPPGTGVASSFGFSAVAYEKG